MRHPPVSSNVQVPALHVSVVHVRPSSHSASAEHGPPVWQPALGEPEHMPDVHTSLSVQESPSEHAVPSVALLPTKVHAPLSQTSVVQLEPSSQSLSLLQVPDELHTGAFVPAHRPAASHMSFTVHASPSLHGVLGLAVLYEQTALMQVAVSQRPVGQSAAVEHAVAPLPHWAPFATAVHVPKAIEG